MVLVMVMVTRITWQYSSTISLPLCVMIFNFLPVARSSKISGASSPAMMMSTADGVALMLF